MSATLGTAWGWLLMGSILGAWLAVQFVEYLALRRRERPTTELSTAAHLAIVDAQWAPVIEAIKRGESPALPPSAFDDRAWQRIFDLVKCDCAQCIARRRWNQALPDKPMRHATLDELLGPTVEEPPT